MTIDTDFFKGKLEEEKKVLTEELSGLGVYNKATNDWEATPDDDKPETAEADENDRADRFESFEERTATLGTLETRLNAVNHALEKIKDGSYGICEKGGEHIDKDRLNANPAAATCVVHMNG